MRAEPHPWVRAAGLPLAWLYGTVIRARNRRFDRGEGVTRTSLPVVSVGNLTVGGTGKTPLVGWLARQLAARGRVPAVILRGYRGHLGPRPRLVSRGGGPLCPATECGDEAYLLASELPAVRVVAGADRVAGVELAAREGADLVLLDDGFQHRRIARDLDLVLLDALRPLGNGRLLPAGPLREAPEGLQRADLILLTGCRSGTPTEAAEATVRRFNAQAPVIRVGHRCSGFFDAAGRRREAPRAAVAFCGIARPERFREELMRERVDVRAFRSFRDHHRFRPRQLAQLLGLADRLSAELVTTAKDWVRLAGPAVEEIRRRTAVLRIEADPREPAAILNPIEQLLEAEIRIRPPDRID